MYPSAIGNTNLAHNYHTGAQPINLVFVTMRSVVQLMGVTRWHIEKVFNPGTIILTGFFRKTLIAFPKPVLFILPEADESVRMCLH